MIWDFHSERQDKRYIKVSLQTLRWVEPNQISNIVFFIYAYLKSNGEHSFYLCNSYYKNIQQINNNSSL